MKTKTMRIITGLVFLCISLTTFAREYHVSATGSDDNPGTAELPYKTIFSAASIARAGDVITIHEGIYREMISPEHGGTSKLNRITYRAAEGERVVIKGSEVIKDWKKVKGSVWKAVVPNSLFGDYNPYADLLEGDWLNTRGINHHTGEVFLNGEAMFEQNSLEEVQKPEPFEDARNKEFSIYTWYSEVGEEHTTLWANFQDYDPTKELVEINVRPSCFYPSCPGVDYITVRGFIMDQAATQWAAPTAEQPGLIGTHWSKGWIIEDNVVSNSKSVGITLGKERGTGHNVWMHNPVKDGATHYNEVIFRALEIGWSKEKIGSHIVRNNEIFDCGQAGIVGSLGAVYSKILNNHIHDIWKRRTFTGAEMAGIKIHASVDMLIKNNRIHNTGRAIWLDWMAQGVRVTCNLMYDNTREDFFAEVNHGPYMVDNNVLLSNTSVWDMSEGGAYSHNLMAGNVRTWTELNRFTPYLLPHSTKVKALRNIFGGDNRYMNNIFLNPGTVKEEVKDRQSACYGLHGTSIVGFESIAEGNVYYGGAKPGEQDTLMLEIPDFHPRVELSEKEDGIYLELEFDRSLENVWTSMVRTERLGMTIVSEAVFELPDGSPYQVISDYFGIVRDPENPLPGPFEDIREGTQTFRVW